MYVKIGVSDSSMMNVRQILFEPLDLYNGIEGTYNTVEDCSSDALYREDPKDRCDICYDIVGTCKGHISLLKLVHTHINPLFEDYCNDVLSCICGQCKRIVKTMSNSASINRWKHYVRLVKEYGKIFGICKCTQSDKVSMWRYADKIKYIEGIAQSRHNIFITDVKYLLCRYVVVIPYKVVSIMTNAEKIIHQYRKLTDRKGHVSVEAEGNIIRELYTLISKSIGGKTGMCRQNMVTTVSGHNCRGVLASDPNLPIDHISISSSLYSTLLSTVRIDRHNYGDILNDIREGKILHIESKRDRYKLVSNVIYIIIVDIDSPIGIDETTTFTSRGKTVRGDGNMRDILSLLEGEGCQIRKGNKLHLVERGSYYISVACLDPRIDGNTLYIPLAIGDYVVSNKDYTPVTIHRNPVMSADSMRRLIAIPHKKEFCTTISPLEKYNSRVRAANMIQYINHNNRQTKYIVENVVRIRRTEPFPTVTTGSQCYVLQESVEVGEDEPYYDNDVTEKINPVITRGFGADFDGDEMNVKVTTSEGDEISITVDMLRIKDGKPIYFPIHDARLGLWLLVMRKSELVERLIKIKYTIESVLSGEDVKCDKEIVERINGIREKYNRLTDTNITSYRAMKELQRRNRERENIEITKTLMEHIFNLDLKGIFKDWTVLYPLLEILKDKDSVKYLDPYTFNKLAVDSCNIIYDSLDNIGTYYSNILLALYTIADSYGISFDYSKDSTKDIIESGCRPTVETYRSIYNSIGNIKYILPGNRIVRCGINGNYISGLTMEEYIELCYANRLSLSTKAKTAAPAGDIMRHMCSYLSCMSRYDEKWYCDKQLFYIDVNNVDISKRILEYMSLKHNFVECIDLNMKAFEYIDPKLLDNRILKRLEPELHRGQRKLLLMEVAFLNRVYEEGDIMVYIGAAPGSHIEALLFLYPGLILHLYDENKFCKHLSKYENRITIFNRLFTEKDIEVYKDYDNVILYSDIRSDNINGKEYSVMQDNEFNMKVVENMNPKAAMLKFRIPFSDEVTNTTVIKGKFMLQPWVHTFSTETRLLCTRPYTRVTINNKEYDNAMFTHNLRRRSKFNLPIVKYPLLKDLEKLHVVPGYDYLLETRILSEYCENNNYMLSVLYKELERYKSIRILQ